MIMMQLSIRSGMTDLAEVVLRPWGGLPQTGEQSTVVGVTISAAAVMTIETMPEDLEFVPR